MFRETGTAHPAEFTEDMLLAWFAQHARNYANNSVRQHATQVHTFLRWCVRSGVCDDNAALALVDRDSPLRSIPRTFGKAQAKNPARWLNADEARALVAVCDDGTDLGLRDEIVIRLTLQGMRGGEVQTIRIGCIDLDRQHIAWLGKARKARSMVPSPGLVDALRRYFALYARALGRPLGNSDPLVCPGHSSNYAHGRVRYGLPVSYPTIFRIVQRRAAAAGLGHVAPHDMRRTTANLLHSQTDGAGHHAFDLRDIQQVLDHASPTTTVMYLNALDSLQVRDRASKVLDW